MSMDHPTLLEDLLAAATQTIRAPWFPAVAGATLTMIGLAKLAKRSIFALAFVMIFCMPAGAFLMLVEKRDWRPLWKRLYVALAGSAGIFYLQAFRPSGLHPVDAWLVSIWAGGLLAGGFFFLHWRHLFVVHGEQAENPVNRVLNLLSEKEILAEQMLVSVDGATGIGFHAGREMAYLVRPGKSFPQEIAFDKMLSVLLVEDDGVLAESTATSRLIKMPFHRDRFWPALPTGQTRDRIESVELRIAVADFLEPILVIQFLSSPVKRGGKRHDAALVESRRWFQIVERWLQLPDSGETPIEPQALNPESHAP